MNIGEFLATSRDAIAVISAIFTVLSFLLIAWLSTRFVTVKQHGDLAQKFEDLEKSFNAVAKELDRNDNDEARKRRDLQEKVTRLEERVSHLPTGEQVRTILLELGRANARLESVDGRLDDMQATMRREVDSVKELVGSVQETMRMIQGARA